MNDIIIINDNSRRGTEVYVGKLSDKDFALALKINGCWDSHWFDSQEIEGKEELEKIYEEFKKFQVLMLKKLYTEELKHIGMTFKAKLNKNVVENIKTNGTLIFIGTD